MNRTLIRQLLASLALGALLVGGASAAEPASPTIPADSTPVKDDSDAKPRQQNCLRETGTRIKRKNGGCVGLAGRSYSAEELRQTGETNPVDALRRLDSSITGSVR